MTAPAVIACNLAETEAAIAASAAGGGSLTIVSAAGFAGSAGAGYFKAMIAAAAAAHPGVRVAAFLDCGDSPGLVLAALREGVGGVIFLGQAAVAAKLDAIARARGATLLRQRPAAVDLAALGRQGQGWQEQLRKTLGNGGQED